jgi:D-alanyl-D-alanine carboxypeptidase (penicillin-binding protein 5/6)
LVVAAALSLWFWFRPAGGVPHPADPPPIRPMVLGARGLPVDQTPGGIQWVSSPIPAPQVGEPDGLLTVYGQPTVLWSRNPNRTGPVASTTKLMTAYLTAESLPLNQTVTISDWAAGIGGSTMFLKPGAQLTVRQLLYGMLMRSANNAATALAQTVSGTVPAFVAEMNRTAGSLGLHNTAYKDPDGILPGSRSSAADLVRLAELDLKIPILRQIVHTKETSLPLNPVVSNINGILWEDPTVIGLKTGWTTPAGTCLVFAATRMVDGHPITLVGALLHGTTFPPEYQDAEALLNWGYKVITPTVRRLAAEHDLPATLTPGPG